MNKSHLNFICANLQLGTPVGMVTSVYGCRGGSFMWRVNTEARSYAIKQLAPIVDITSEKMTAKYELSERIAFQFIQQGIPAVAAIEKSGKRLITIDNIGYLIYPWTEGYSLSRNEISEIHALKIAEIIAKLHSIIALTLVIEAYERHTTMFRTWNADEQKEHWIHGIGGAQLQLPLSVLQDFLSDQELSPLECRDKICKDYRAYYMVPNFDVAPKRLCNVYDGNSVTPTSSGLGNVVALYRIEHREAYFSSNLNSEVMYGSGYNLWVRYSDLMVFKHYCKVRTENLNNQILSLESELQAISDIAAAASPLTNKPTYR